MIDNGWVATDPVVGFLTPILWQNTRRNGGAELYVAGAKGYLSNISRFMLLREDLKQILAQTRSTNIPVIVLKGAVLAETGPMSYLFLLPRCPQPRIISYS